ncbi:hypothetical protein BJX99DRAFT_186484 [Aspergillus californicus]
MSYTTKLADHARDVFLRATTLSDNRARIILATAPAAVLALFLPAAYRDYQSYLALGPGGPPYNVIGWLAVKLFTPFRREMFGTRIYDRKVQGGQDVEFLTDLPRRDGERPTMGAFTVPQRQINQQPSQEMKEKFMAAYIAFLDKNAHVLDHAPSILERFTEAGHVRGDVLTPVAKQMRREIFHVHGTSDHSIHVVLTPRDCKRVIEAGWGQRFPLAGSTFLRNLSFGRLGVLPEEYVLVYAPRTEEEIQIVIGILAAGVKYVAGSSDVR